MIIFLWFRILVSPLSLIKNGGDSLGEAVRSARKVEEHCTKLFSKIAIERRGVMERTNLRTFCWRSVNKDSFSTDLYGCIFRSFTVWYNFCNAFSYETAADHLANCRGPQFEKHCSKISVNCHKNTRRLNLNAYKIFVSIRFVATHREHTYSRQTHSAFVVENTTFGMKAAVCCCYATLEASSDI
jgi:hypothetical protein